LHLRLGLPSCLFPSGFPTKTLHAPLLSRTRYVVALRSKDSPQKTVLKHRHPTFLPECERPGFATIQNNR
jgi:hypothetical protein